MYSLTTNQHERLRNLVRRSPVFIGMRVVVHDDWMEVVSPEELEFGLGPVFDAVAGAPTDQWPKLVDDCLGQILDALTGKNADLDGPTEQLLDRMYVKLRPLDGDARKMWPYALEVAPDLLMVLALDYPNYIALLNGDRVRQHGFDRLLEAGMNNMYGQVPNECATHAGIFIIEGSDYLASTVMVLPWVVEAVTGDPDVSHGVLVAVPNDNMLIFHALKDGAAAGYAVGEIARVATECYEDSQRPLSRHVYWWSPDTGYLEPVAHHVGGDSGVIGQDIATHYSPGYAGALDRLDG
ncbi:hypothetical protein [Actinophytocola sp.]|uniref:hypothetical protein n=1 Tax=Actinophytocola sp. TaxID=1872138 RepID=UPI002ED659C7